MSNHQTVALVQCPEDAEHARRTMHNPRLVVRNYDLYVVLGGAAGGIIDADDLLDPAQREKAQAWIEKTLLKWITSCQPHLQNNDLLQILARTFYWPLLEIILIIEILLVLKMTYADCDTVRIYAPERTWLDKIARRLFLPQERHWEVLTSFGIDLRSRYEDRRPALYPFQGPETFLTGLRKTILKLLSKINQAFGTLCGLTDSVLVLGEARFLPLIRALRFSSVAASGNFIKCFPFVASPAGQYASGDITRHLERCFKTLDTLTLPVDCWSYRGINLDPIIRNLYDRDVIAQRSEWLSAAHYHECLLKEYKPKLVVFSTIESERNAIAGLVANALGIPCLGMLDGYLAYNTSTSNTGFHTRPQIDWFGFCCETHKTSILKAGIAHEQLISMPSPCIRSFKPAGNQGVRYDVIVFSYFVTLTTVTQYSGSYGRYLMECLKTARVLNFRSVLIKCRYDAEIPYVRNLIAKQGHHFERIEIVTGPSANYYRKADQVIGGVSTTMMECAKSGGQYYVYEPVYGGMALPGDKQTLKDNPVFAVTPEALTRNIQNKHFFGATPAQQRRFGIDIHLQRAEKSVWRKSIAKILKKRLNR